ncbi:heat shock protein 40 [Leptolyngbya sp. NIES-3755]|nr:heat shock protein 40 [Leptolyngbya sp. NIES-3755]
MEDTDGEEDQCSVKLYLLSKIEVCNSPIPISTLPVNRQDPEGYYSILGVSTNASISEIKAAFRQRAKQLHPDHNASPYASQNFQQLKQAYEVLSNPETRAQYDTSGVDVSHYAAGNEEQVSSQEPLEPLTCSMCHQVTAQPRYIIFYNVKSFFVMTVRTPVQGIFCRNCADEQSLRNTVITWLLGWWGFPWGLMFSTHAIINNLVGGHKPRDINARLLAYQAYVFATQEKFDLARAVGADALNLLPRRFRSIDVASSRTQNIPKEDSEWKKFQIMVTSLLQALDNGKPINHLKNNWSLLGRGFYLQCALIATVISIGSNFVFSSTGSPSRSLSPAESKSIVPPTQSVAPSTKPAYVRPKLADNGRPFPTASGYIDGYPLDSADGYSKVTIDNGQNDSDVFVKLFSLGALGTDKPQPVRVFLIRAREQFTIENLSPGGYDIRYRNLDTGRLQRSEPFQLEEFKTATGVQFSQVRLTLYRVRGGNTQIYDISEGEF